jgi:HEPN domain-containing protein
MSPRNQERLFPVAYSQELLRIAQADHDSAVYLLGGVSVEHGVRPENAAYLFQQAIGKALKAALCARELPVPLVQDLGVLIARIPDDLEPEFGYELGGLDEYATVRRYEEGRYTLQQDELEEMQRYSKQVLSWASRIVSAASVKDSP